MVGTAARGDESRRSAVPDVSARVWSNSDDTTIIMMTGGDVTAGGPAGTTTTTIYRVSMCVGRRRSHETEMTGDHVLGQIGLWSLPNKTTLFTVKCTKKENIKYSAKSYIVTVQAVSIYNS